MLSAPFRNAGRMTLGFLADTGELWRLAVTAGSRLVVGPFRGERLRLGSALHQTVRAGYDSLALVSLITVLIGMIMALQSAYQLRQLGALNLVANLVAVSMTRELAPLLTAIIVAGRFGSSIAAELGTMRVSQEIDALVVMGIDPTSSLVVPRLLALLISMPCLTIFADVVGMFGGFAVGVGGLGLGAAGYVSDTLSALRLQDIYTGLVKSVAFAAIIGLVGCHQGLRATGGPEAVGQATTSTVVRSIVLVIATDLFVTALFYLEG